LAVQTAQLRCDKLIPNEDSFDLSSLDGITDGAKNCLLKAGIHSIRDVVVRGENTVSEVAGIPMESSRLICNKARTKLEQLGAIPAPYTSTTDKEVEQISLGSKSLDTLLGGGVQTGAITEFFGESNAGKTQICHTLCVMVQQTKSHGGLDGKALYIDTESTFSIKRIASIAEARGLDANRAIKNVICAKPMSSTDQDHYVRIAGSIIDGIKNVRLLIVDSIISLYRAEYLGRAVLSERQQKLYRQMQMLRRISEVYKVAVVITNQVHQTPDNYPLDLNHKPLGGHVMAHASTYRIHLRVSGVNRKAVLVHSPYLPENVARFTLSEQGVSDVMPYDEYEDLE
jgi:DNA repair protein RadA